MILSTTCFSQALSKKLPVNTDSTKYVELKPVFAQQLKDLQLERQIQSTLIQTKEQAILNTIIINEVEDYTAEKYEVMLEDGYLVVRKKKALKPTVQQPPTKN